MSNPNGRNSHQKNELKNKLAKKHGCKCKICGKTFALKFLTLDHIIPLAHGGSWSITNLQLACYQCNQEKSDTNLYKDAWDLI